MSTLRWCYFCEGWCNVVYTRTKHLCIVHLLSLNLGMSVGTTVIGVANGPKDLFSAAPPSWGRGANMFFWKMSWNVVKQKTIINKFLTPPIPPPPTPLRWCGRVRGVRKQLIPGFGPLQATFAKDTFSFEEPFYEIWSFIKSGHAHTQTHTHTVRWLVFKNKNQVDEEAIRWG